MYDGNPDGTPRHRCSTFSDAVNYVRGGWNQLVERIVGRASDLGVDLHLRSRIERIEPWRTTIVATGPDAAERMLADPQLRADGQAWHCATSGSASPATRAP
jgi:phytoene dehydrogenase-like protein